MTPEAAVADDYRRRAASHAGARDVAGRRASRIANVRLVTFLVAFVAAAAVVVGKASARSLTGALAVVAGGVFAALVVAADRARREEEWQDARRQLCEEGAHRVLRAWDQLPARTAAAAPPDHPYAADLDVEGPASLMTLLGVGSEAFGRPTLRGWMLGPPPDVAVIRGRQAAARELAPLVEWREELAAYGRLVGRASPEATEAFLRWAEGPAWLLERPALLWAARLLPALIVASIALALSTSPLAPAGASLALLLAVGSATFAFAVRAKVKATLDLAGRATPLRRQVVLLGHAASRAGEAPLLAELRARLTRGGGAAAALGRLQRVAAYAEVRYSPMLYGVVQALACWDVHVAAALERWRRDAGRHARDWLAALGEAEAVAALATLAHDNPGWCVPEFREEGDAVIAGTALGHPLIAPAARVANDVAVGPPGTLLLITGSNMSGKSTLLRAIGLNVVLAQAGAPACAARLTLPRLAPWTSIRIQDSLEQGISLFMAELHRLKRVVDAAQASARADAGAALPVLYLLDEMLHGTNTAERRVAARIVLGQLIAAGAIGAITTHDVDLAAEGFLAEASRPVHFTETFLETAEGPQMTFDYTLRPGIATSVNALKLLRIVGLDPGAPR